MPEVTLSTSLNMIAVLLALILIAVSVIAIRLGTVIQLLRSGLPHSYDIQINPAADSAIPGASFRGVVKEHVMRPESH